MLWDLILRGFGTLGCHFGGSGGSWKWVGILTYSGTSPGTSLVKGNEVGDGKLSVRGVQLTVTKHQLADLQPAKSRYQVGKQVIEGIEGTWKQQLVIESLASQPGGRGRRIYIYYIL